MPEPPLLLADRVIGIEGEPNGMKLGTIWTETDVTEDAWYLNAGYMPAGITIESGQADLMLISYLGIDAHNRGERAYRLLGCQLTYHGDLPKPGDTLRYEIDVDGHARQGDIRLFFFHYDCTVDGQPKLTVRNGQAGFFSDQELADSAGVLWSPEEQDVLPDARVDAPDVVCTRERLDDAQLAAFAEGRVWECFGPGFEFSKTHVRTPTIQSGRMRFIDDVVELSAKGGPWGRGYLRGEATVRPDDWFFDGHFKNDPCMPGTLMFEGCLQAMSIFLTSLGYTLQRDGWRFQPVPEMQYDLQCRGQVTQASKNLVYEVFVEEIIAGPQPTIIADLLCTIDGLKAFHARRVGLELVPDWPLTSQPELLDGFIESKPVAKVDGFEFGYASLLACAWGKPSDAFGPMYRVFDGHRRVARLPGPPYHFMSRVTEVVGPIGEPKAGAEVTIEYDVPPDAWYFDENGRRRMPYCVLLEAVLQPCGWLASYVGSAAGESNDLSFRNLDGTGAVLADLPDDIGTITTHVKLTNVSKSAGMIIESFDVKCHANGVPVYEFSTVFGFFPQEALRNQVGLSTKDDQRLVLTAPSDFSVDLTECPARYCAGPLRLAQPMLLMIDRVTGYWPADGVAGLGRLRAEKDVDPAEWFFKAHFFQDPVQPGSLGIEAMLQLLQFYMIEANLAEGLVNPRFEPVANGDAHRWKYRGQVVPSNRLISTTLDITAVQGRTVKASASLWVDGKRIYEADIGMRIVEGDDAAVTRFDPDRDEWIRDHCPTWTVPALPMTSIVDRLLAAAGSDTSALADVRLKRWVVVDRPVDVVAERRDDRLSLTLDGDVIATAKVATATERPAPWAPIQGEDGEEREGGEALPSPYTSGALFHGPSFQILTALRRSRAGYSAVLDASALPSSPVARVILLDGATHAIPHDELRDDKVAYPAAIDRIELFGPTPTVGNVRCEVRIDEAASNRDLVTFDIQLIHDGNVWAQFRLLEAWFSKGPIGQADRADRRSFLRDRQWRAGVGLSREEGGVTTLRVADVARSDWLPGTIEAVYGTRDPVEIARKEHCARQVEIHPGRVFEALPLTRFDATATQIDGAVTVSSACPPSIDLGIVRSFWDGWFDDRSWPVADLYYGLIERFVRRVVYEAPDEMEALTGRSCLYLANHQVGVESLVFSIVASALNAVPTVTLAKIEHQDTWLGHLIRHCFQYPDVRDPEVITYFDRTDRESLPRIIGQLAQQMSGPGRSVMVHVEGTRSLTCRAPVAKMSGAFIDMAVGVGVPIVPVRFVGGLPVDSLSERIEFPIGMGQQDIWFGRPLSPDELRGAPYGERKQRVVDAINALGPSNDVEVPFAGDASFVDSVRAHVAATRCTEEHAVLFEVLSERAQRSAESDRLLQAVRDKTTILGDDALSRWLSVFAGWMTGY